MQIKVKQMDQINYLSFLLEFHFLAARNLRNEGVIIIELLVYKKINSIHFAECFKRGVIILCAFSILICSEYKIFPH